MKATIKVDMHNAAKGNGVALAHILQRGADCLKRRAEIMPSDPAVVLIDSRGVKVGEIVFAE